MKPLLYDTYCGGGGATRGYMNAGFRVIGVDIKAQPRYCGDEFIQMDALEFLERLAKGEFEQPAAIHASPPCQFYSRLRYLPWLRDKVYWRSIPPTREALQATGKPYIIENVEDAVWDMDTPAILCGGSIGLNIYRHRCFETWPFAILQPGHHPHKGIITPGRASLSKRRHGLNGWNGVAGHQAGVARHRKEMGIDWMTGAELAQAIPPAYTEFIGACLMAHILAGGRE